MIKRVLGIRELESNIKKLRNFFDNHWGHTNHLHSKTDHHTRRLSEHSERLDKVEKELENKTKSIILVMENILSKLEGMQITTVSEPEVIEQTVVVHKKEFADKDKIILQIMHQNAAFSKDSSLETNYIYTNLPFSITPRGLRKKLAALEDLGLVASRKEGKKNKWFVRTGKLAEVSGIISEPKKKKRNRN